MGRAPCCDKTNVKKGPWSPEEDAKLKAFIEQHGTGGNWIALPQKIGLKRCGKSCRLRWLNYLRPNIKHGGFSEEEDNIICSLYISIGSRWSIIAAQLPGRTDNDIKNYWNTRLKKKLLGRRRESQSRRSSNQENKHGPMMNSINSASDQEPPSNNNLQNLSASALERMQLHFQLQKLHPLSHFNPIFWSRFQMLGGKLFQTSTSDDTKEASIPIPTSTATQIEPTLFDGFASVEMEQTHLNQVLQHQSCAAGIDPYQNSFNGFDGGCNSIDGSVISNMNCVGQPNMNFQVHSDFPIEHNDLIYCKTDGGSIEDRRLDGLDCFNEMESATTENMVWWGNGFEPKCSTNPWESVTSVDHERCQERTLLQEYVLDYDLQ